MSPAVDELVSSIIYFNVYTHTNIDMTPYTDAASRPTSLFTYNNIQRHPWMKRVTLYNNKKTLNWGIQLTAHMPTREIQ
jgi:hypothetical protein